MAIFNQKDELLTKCVVCQTTERLICGECNSKQMQQTWRILKEKRKEAVLYRQKLDLQLKTNWENKSSHQKQKMLKEKTIVEKLVSEIKQLTASIHSKRIQVTEVSFNLERRLAENTSSRNDLETAQTRSDILYETLLSELSWHMDASMASFRLQQWKSCLTVFRTFKLHSTTDGVASIMGIPLPSTIALWPSLPAPILGQSLSLACRLVTAIANNLNIPLPHPCFAICPIDGYGAWAGIGQQSINNYNTIHLLKPPWYCDNGLSFDDDLELDEKKVTSVKSTEHDRDDDKDEDEENDDHKIRRENEFNWTIETGDSAFSTAVTLLQTTVLNLCIRAQVPMVDLHPETILVNLAHLRNHLEQQTQLAVEEGGDVALPQHEQSISTNHELPFDQISTRSQTNQAEVNTDMIFPNQPYKEEEDIESSNSKLQFEDWENIDGSIPPQGLQGAEDQNWSSSSPAWLTNVLPTTTVWDLASNLKGYQQR